MTGWNSSYTSIGLVVGGLLLAGSVVQADTAEKEVHLAAGRVNLRTADGDLQCTLDKKTAGALVAVGRHADGERVKVRVNAKGCPGEGYIYSNYLRPVDVWGQEDVITSVEPEELALRETPSPHGKFACGLPKGAQVKVVEDSPPGASTSSWVKIEVLSPKPGCPKEGFVNGSYLNMPDVYQDLPITDETVPLPPARPNTEAGFCPPGGSCGREKTVNAANIEDLKAVVDQAPKGPPKGSFWDGLKELIRNPRKKPSQLLMSRGLVQMPLEGDKGNIGPCGSHHYNPDSPKGVDAYTNPTTACAFMSVLQNWKKNNCPNRSGCTLSWGDISHKTKPKFNTHQSHTDGQCIDIRPMRKGGFADQGMNYGSVVCAKRVGGRCVATKQVLDSAYDQDKTRELVKALRAAGGAKMYFNDTSLGTTQMSGHSNHIHVCFPPDSSAVKKTCDSFVPDLNVCPELQ